MSALRITEIFRSLQGESTRVGLPTVFVRLTGCPLRCTYCDTAYAFHGGRSMPIDDIVNEVLAYRTQQVCVTGGEPLAQAGCTELLHRLCESGLDVSLETGGALDIAAVDQRVTRVMDLKTPGSGEVQRNRWENLQHLRAHDEIKFVICDRADFDWAADCCRQHALADRCTVLFSPCHELVEPQQLADWLLESGLQARLQIQLHKLLWGNRPGH